jgi:hypothetical protein
MAFNDSAPEQPDNTIRIVGSDSTPISQDAMGRIEALLLGGQGSAIQQDANGRLEAILLGNENIAIDQEPGTGKALFRLGGDAAESDIDIATASNPTNIGTDGSAFESGQRQTGGAREVAISAVSDDDAAFNVEIEWMDENGNVLRTEAPSALQGVTDINKATIIAVSDNFNLRLADASGNAQNNVYGTANSH